MDREPYEGYMRAYKLLKDWLQVELTRLSIQEKRTK